MDCFTVNEASLPLNKLYNHINREGHVKIHNGNSQQPCLYSGHRDLKSFREELSHYKTETQAAVVIDKKNALEGTIAKEEVEPFKKIETGPLATKPWSYYWGVRSHLLPHMNYKDKPDTELDFQFDFLEEKERLENVNTATMKTENKIDLNVTQGKLLCESALKEVQEYPNLPNSAKKKIKYFSYLYSGRRYEEAFDVISALVDEPEVTVDLDNFEVIEPPAISLAFLLYSMNYESEALNLTLSFKNTYPGLNSTVSDLGSTQAQDYRTRQCLSALSLLFQGDPFASLEALLDICARNKEGSSTVNGTNRMFSIPDHLIQSRICELLKLLILSFECVNPRFRPFTPEDVSYLKKLLEILMPLLYEERFFPFWTIR